MSGEVVLMTLVGGLVTILGPVVGAFFLTAMQHYLAQPGSWVTVVQGIILCSACWSSAAASRPMLPVAASRPASRRMLW
jgi:ABC-type branched-subunit amino acid transport system permease subunit